MFVDREDELAWLASGWESGQAELRILYGRRRVGKSRLLDRFAEGKRAVVFQATEGTTTDHLRDLSEAMLACEDDQSLREAPLANWGQALDLFGRMAERGRLLIVFEEYQYAAEADPTLASQLQRWWSERAMGLPVLLLLCGSHIRFFAENVLAGPAYARNTGSWRLYPLDCRGAARFFPDWSHEDHVRAYAVAGGIPHYLLQLDPRRSLSWNIQHRVLDRGSVLYQDAELLLREELREPRVYFSILRAMSDGCTRLSEINNRIGTQVNLTPYLNTLEALGLASLSHPLGGKERRGVWTVSDPYLRFWFHFVLPHRSQLEHGASAQRVYEQFIAPELDSFVSKPTFEEVCRAWLVSQRAAGAFADVTNVGAWWGPIPGPTPENPRRQVEAEIAIVATAGDRVRLLGDAKWSQEPTGFAVLNHLRQAAAHIPGVDASTQLCLFAREFSPRLRAAAEQEGVLLVDVAGIFGDAAGLDGVAGWASLEMN